MPSPSLHACFLHFSFSISAPPSLVFPPSVQVFRNALNALIFAHANTRVSQQHSLNSSADPRQTDHIARLHSTSQSYCMKAFERKCRMNSVIGSLAALTSIYSPKMVSFSNPAPKDILAYIHCLCDVFCALMLRFETFSTCIQLNYQDGPSVQQQQTQSLPV